MVAAVAIAMAEQHDRNLPWAFKSKEAKDHGAGSLVGTVLKGRVVIVDDVVTARTAIRESVNLVRSRAAFSSVAR